MYTQNEVDDLIRERDDFDAQSIFEEKLPGYAAKLKRLDARIISLLKEIQQVFPDAQYYTASGGFGLLLGDSHDGRKGIPQQQRSAWSGDAQIGDGDY